MPARFRLLPACCQRGVRAVGEYVLRQEQPVQDGRLLDVFLQLDRLQTSLAALLDRVGYVRRARDVDVAAILSGYHDGTAQPQPALASELADGEPGDGTPPQGLTA